MKMRRFFSLLALCPTLLFSSQVELIADWSLDENGGFLGLVKDALAEKELTLSLSSGAAYKPFLENKKNKTPCPVKEEISSIVLWNVGQKMKKWDFSRLPKEKMVLFMWEPPTVQKRLYTEKVQSWFSKIYTWDDDLVDNKKFFKFYYPSLSAMRKEIPSFKDKKLCTMISSNRESSHPQELYSARKRVIQFFEENGKGDFDFYGWGWEKSGYKNYGGSVPDKGEVLKKYRFTICYENIEGKKGYVTEKIFDAMAAGCVPVYLGASNIQEYIPANCFVDRRKFKSEKELYLFLKNMDESEYKGYLKNITSWLDSDKAKLFSQEHFARTFLEAVAP